MPIYEYRCDPCDKTFEELIVRKSDEAEVACPECKSREVSRLLSRTSAPRTGGAGPSGPGRSCGPIG
jgi:putative FmdB family regulatory protein